MIKRIAWAVYGVIQFLLLVALTPFVMGYGFLFFSIDSPAFQVALLTFWMYGVVMGYGVWFHAKTIMAVFKEYERLRKVHLEAVKA